MEQLKVSDIMVPAAEFPKIFYKATFYEALMALDEAQEKYQSGENKQRILLVEDESGKVVGKISPIDMIRGLEPDYEQIDLDKISGFGVSYAMKVIRQQHRLWQTPFADLCRKARDVQIKDFIKASPQQQAVSVDDKLIKAFNWFVMGRYDSLFVYDGNEIIGLLKFSDVYKKIKETMSACGL